MIDVALRAQIPFLAFVMLAACLAKVLVPAPGGRRFALAVAAIEGVLGVGLLTTEWSAVRLATVVLFATATSVLTERTRGGSALGCGCFGRLSAAPAGWRSVVRAALLMVAALASARVPGTGAQAFGGGQVIVFAAEAWLFALLSPELDVLVARLHGPVPCELRDVPPAETYAVLRASEAWRACAGVLTSPEPEEPMDMWRELCHRYLVYPGTIEGRPAEIVFAVPLDGGPVRAAALPAAEAPAPDASGVRLASENIRPSRQAARRS